MPQGLQVWDASGNLILDTSTRLGRVLGYQDVGGYPYSGTIPVPGIETYGTPFITVYNPNSIVTPYWANVAVFYYLETIYWSTDVSTVGENQFRAIWGVY
jgi:hypothetical protein